MKQRIGMLALVVRNYDEAIEYYTRCLRFTLLEDDDRGNGKRWVVLAPQGNGGAYLLLARAVNPQQESRIGDQTGGRVFLFLHTDDFWGDYSYMKGQGVHFIEQPRHEEYGTVVVFQDLYGNKWDLIEEKKTTSDETIS